MSWCRAVLQLESFCPQKIVISRLSIFRRKAMQVSIPSLSNTATSNMNTVQTHSVKTEMLADTLAKHTPQMTAQNLALADYIKSKVIWL